MCLNKGSTSWANMGTSLIYFCRLVLMAYFESHWDDVDNEENGDSQKGRKLRFSKRRQRDDCTLSMGLAAPNQWRKWSDPNGGFLPSTASTSLPPVCPRPPPPPRSPPPPPPPSPPPCLQFVPVLHISPQHLCLKCDNASQKLVLKKIPA